jgi:hypothetical protein
MSTTANHKELAAHLRGRLRHEGIAARVNMQSLTWAEIFGRKMLGRKIFGRKSAPPAFRLPIGVSNQTCHLQRAAAFVGVDDVERRQHALRQLEVAAPPAQPHAGILGVAWVAVAGPQA